jgi:hypothetical protein
VSAAGVAVEGRAGEGVRGGLRMGRARLARRPAVLGAALVVALVVASVAVERHVGTAGAVDRALEASFGLAIPLGAFALVGAALSRERLREAAWPLSRWGASGRAVALGVVAAAALASALLGAFSAALVVLLAHGAGAPPLASDAAISAWLGALAGAVYASWFALGASFGRRGAGRWVPFVLDFALGGTGGVLGAILPRGHLASLLGGAAPLGLSHPVSTAILVGEALALALLAAARCKD